HLNECGARVHGVSARALRALHENLRGKGGLSFMSALAHHQSLLPPLVTDEELKRELQFVQDFRIAEASPTIAGLVRAITPHEHDDRQEHLRRELVRELTAFHAWHERVP